MISVVERLVESWLDSQGERQYQPAFIQLLVSEGWSVLHNTRHSPIELGKATSLLVVQTASCTASS